MSLVRLQAAKMGRTRPSMKSDSRVINMHAPYGFNMKLFSSICILSCLLSLVPPVAARGRLMEPVQRSSLWRRGFDAPVNNDDSGLNCGGSWRQNEQNGGRCGGCGDPYDAVLRDNEPGGVYANGIISNTYTTNDSSILVVIDVQNFLKGYFEFRICAVNDPLRPATQDCLDHHVLRMWDYDAPEPRYRYWPAGAGLQKLRVELPRGLVCQQCVLQWKWHTGLDWGRCEDGLYALGCGPQEEYYNCADIAIVNHAPGGGVDSVQPPLPVVGPAHHQLDNSATYEIGFGSRDISQASASNAQMSSNINRNTRVGIPISFMSNDPLTGQAIEPVQPRFDFFDFVKTTAAPTIHRSTMETVPVKSDTKEISTKQKKTEVVLPFNGDSRAPLPVINNNELQFGSNNELTYDLKPTALPTGSSPDSRIRVSPSVADTLMPGRVIFPSISGISTGNSVSTNQASPSTVTKVSNKRPEMKPMSTIVSNKRTTTFQVPTRNGIPISIFPTAITSFNTEQTPSGTTSHVNPTELPTSLSSDSMPAIVSPTSASHMMFPGVSVNAHFIIDSVSQTHTSPTGPASSAIPTTGQPAVRRKRQAMPSMSPPPPPPTEQSASTATIEFVGGSFGGAAVENMMFGSPSTGPADIGRYPVPSIQPVDRQTGRDPLATEALGEPIVETRVVSTSSTSGVSNSITGSASFGRFDPMSVVALQSTRHAVGASNAVPGQDISLTAQSDITTPDPNAVPYEPPRIPRPPQLTRAEMKASIATDPVISSSISDTGKKTDASFLIGSEYIEGLNEGPSNQAETSTAAKHGTMIIHVDTSGSSSRGSAMGNAIVEYLSPTGATSIADKPKDTVADTRMTHSSIRFQPTAEQLLSQAGSRLPMTLDTTNLEPTGPAPVDPVELQKQALIRQLGEAMGIIPHTPDANFVQMPANTMQSHNPSLSAMLSYMQPGQQQSSGGISQEGRQAQMMDAMSANMNQPGEAMGMIPHTPDPNLVQMPPNTMQSPDPSLSAMLSYMQADQQRSSGGISPKGSQPQMMGAMSSNMNQPGEAMGMIPHTPDTNLVQMPHKSIQSPGPTLSDMLSYMQASQQQSSGGISPEGSQAQMMGAMSSNMNQPGEAMGMIPHTPDANLVQMPPKSVQSPGPTLSDMLSYMQAGQQQSSGGISPEGSQAQMMGAMSSNMNQRGEAMGMIPHTPDANLVQMPPKSVQSPGPTLSDMLSYMQAGQQQSSGGISPEGIQAQMMGAMSSNMNQPGEAMGMIPHTPDANLVQMPPKSMQSPGPTLSDMLSYMQAGKQQSSGGISPEGSHAQMMGAMSSNMNQPGEAMGMIPHTPDANFVKMPPKSMQSPGPTLSAMLSYMQAGKQQGNGGISPEGSQAQMMGAMSGNMNEPGEAMGMIPHTPDANLVQMPPKSMQSPGPTLSAMLSYMQAGKKQGNDGISPEGSQAQMMGAMSSNMNEPGEAMGMIPHTPDANLVQMPPKSVQSPDPTLSAMLSYTQTGQQRSSGGISHVGSQAQMTGAMSGNMNQQLLESTKLRSVPHVNVGQKEMPLTQTPVGMPPLTGTRNVRLTDATGSSLTPMEQQAILRQQQSNMEYLMSSLGARFGQNQQQIQNMMLNKYAMMLGGNAEKVSPPRTSVNLAPDSTATATTTTQNSEAIMFPGSATGTEIPSQIKSSQSDIQSRIDTSVGVAQKQITNGEIQSRISTTVSISPTDHTKADLTVAGQQVNTGVNTEAARSKRPVDLTSQQQMHGDMFQTQGNMAMLPSVKPDVVPSDGVTLVVGAKYRATLETAASGSTGGQVMEASSQTTMEQIDPMQLQSNIQATQFTDSTVSQAAGQTPTETAVNTNVYDASAGDMHSASQVGDTPSTFTGAAAASSFTPLGTQGSASKFSWTLTGSSGTNTDTQQWGWDPALQQWVLVDNTLAPSKQDTQFVSTATTGSIATPTGTGNTGTYQTAKVQSRETVITAISDQTAADMPIIPVSPSKLPDIAAPQVDQKATSEVKTSGTSISTIKAVDTKVPTETVSFGNVMTKGQADITAQQVPTVDSGAADAFMWQNVEYVWDPATNAYVPIFSPTYADSAVGQQDPVAPGPDVATSNQLAQTQTHTAHVSFKSELPQQGPKYTAAGAVDTKPIPAVQPEQQQPVLDIQAQYPQQTLAVQTTEQHMVDGQPKQAIDAPQRQNQQVFDSQVQALDAKTQKMSQVSFEPQPPQQQHAFDVASQTSQQDLHVGQQSTVITQQTQPIVGTVHVAPQQTQHHMNIQTTHQVLETQPAQIANTAQIQFVQTDISSQGLKHKRTPLLTYPTEQQQLQGSGVGRNLPLLATESGAAGPGPHVVAPQSSTGRSGGTVAQSMAQVSQETTQQIESQKVQTMEQPAGRASDTPSSRSQQSSQSYPPVDTIFAPISQSSGAMESHAALSTGSTVSETFTPIGQSGSVVDSITPVGHTGSSSADVATSIAWDAILKAAQAHAAHKTDAAQIPAAAPLDSTAQTTAGQVDPTAYDAFGWPVVPEPVQQIPVPEPQQHIQHSPAIQHQQLQNIPPAQMTSMQISSNTQTAVQPMQLTPIVQTQQQTQLGSQVQSGSSTNTNQQEILHDIFLQWQKTQLAQGQHASIGYLPYPQTQGMGVLQVPAGNVVPATSQILPSQAVQQAQTQAAAQVGLQWQQNQHQQQQQQQQQQLTHNLQNTLARVLAAQAAGQAVAQPAGQSTDQLLTVVPVWMAEMIRNGAINQLSAQPKPQPQPPKPKPAPMPKPPKRKVPIRPDPETRNMVRDMFMQQMRPGTDPLQILVGLTPELLMKSGVNPRIANSGDAFQIIPAVERALGIRIRSRRPGGRAGGPPGANNMGGMDAGPPGGIGGPRGRMSPRARALARRQFMQQQKLQTEMMQMLGLGPEPLEPGDPGYRGPPGGATSMIPGVAPGMEPTDAQAAAHAARQARGGGTSSMGSMGGMGAMSGLGAMGGMGGMGAMAGMGSTAGGRGGRSRQQQMSAMMEMIGM